MKQLIKMTMTEAKLFMREPVNAFFTLLFPLMMLVLYGTIANSIVAQGPEVVAAADEYMTKADNFIPGLTAMIIGTTGLMSTTITMATYRENGILRRLRTTPVSPMIVMAAQVIVLFIMTAIGMALLVLVGRLAYGITFSGSFISLAAGFTLASLGFFTIGFILAGTLPTARSAQVVAMALMYPMLLLSGAFFSLNLLPGFVQKISQLLPLTYVFNLLHGLWYGSPWSDHLLDVAVLAGMCVVGGFIAIRTFRWE